MASRSQSSSTRAENGHSVLNTEIAVIGTKEFFKNERCRQLFESAKMPSDLYDFFCNFDTSKKLFLGSQDVVLSKGFPYTNFFALLDLKRWNPVILFFVAELSSKLSGQLDKMRSLITDFKPPISTLPRFLVGFSLDKEFGDMNVLENFCEQNGIQRQNMKVLLGEEEILRNNLGIMTYTFLRQMKTKDFSQTNSPSAVMVANHSNGVSSTGPLDDNTFPNRNEKASNEGQTEDQEFELLKNEFAIVWIFCTWSSSFMNCTEQCTCLINDSLLTKFENKICYFPFWKLNEKELYTQTHVPTHSLTHSLVHSLINTLRHTFEQTTRTHAHTCTHTYRHSHTHTYTNAHCNGCSPCVSQRKLYTAQFVLSGYKICPDTSFMQFAFVTVYPLCCTYRCIY